MRFFDGKRIDGAMSSILPDRDDLLAALDRAMRGASAQSVLVSQVTAEQLGMNRTDLECLDILNVTGPITAGRLAELTGLTTGAVTGLVDRLETAGYVQRERDPSDRRRVIVRLVPEATERIGLLFAPMAREMAELCGRYSDEELRLLLDFFDRAGNVARAHVARLRQGAAPVGEPQHGGAAAR